MAGHLVLAGRAKDTIVLASGENVEPAPLEDAVGASPFIAQAVIVGQDRRALGALVVPADDAFAELAAVRGGARPRLCRGAALQRARGRRERRAVRSRLFVTPGDCG